MMMAEMLLMSKPKSIPPMVEMMARK